uniref:Protein kinase domain-containing protein n=1 Tax=Physcomitrium patens TaxID=3218 RepID=A0A7I4FKM5_PHYPA
MSVRERPNAKYGDLQVKERVTQLLYCGIQSRLTVFERLALVLFLFLALDTFGVAGLNADGIALLEFKKSITSDAQSALQNWNYVDDTPCYWNGITCMKVQGVDRVVQIVLPRKSLGGTLSPYLGNLTYLAVVNLDTNNFTGQIPGELFKSPALSSLYLSDNNFSGAIPTAICALGDQLRVIELNGNRLAGGFPDDFLNCYGLRRLVLSYNNFKGPIPLGIGSKLTQLKRLDLSVNHFNGSIPEDFGNLTNLLPQFPLNLSNNRFSGAIPPSLANLGRVLIDLSNNNLSGPVPPDSYFQAQGPTSYIGNANLCGSPLKVDCASSPSPSLSPFDNIAGTSATGSFSKRPLSKAAIIGIGVGCAIVGLLMASILFYFILRKLHIRKKSLGLNSPARSDNASSLRGCLCSWRESGGGSMSADEDDENDLMHLSGVLSFSLEELLRASAYVLGKSGVGIIYKAVLDDGTMVAVRRLGEGGEQRQKEFESEVKTIAQVRHLNIVTLHSYSWRAEEKLLIYDYVSNGNLETALHSRSNASKGPLTWEMRLQIAIGAAQGLAHIHECSARKA